MARIIGSKCKLCRAYGEKLFLKGQKCSTEKCSVARRAFPPGQHGKRRRKDTDYGLQLREKQKAKRIYGILEKQFNNYFKIAERSKGVTGEVLLGLLERRLDNVVFRLGFAFSRAQARQLTRHNTVYVNAKKVNIPSYLVRQGDMVEIKGKENRVKVASLIRKELKDRIIPKWLEPEKEALKALIKRLPGREDIDFSIQEQLIVELYSK